MTDSVEKTINQWIDKNSRFTEDDLVSAFPWMNKALAEEKMPVGWNTD